MGRFASAPLTIITTVASERILVVDDHPVILSGLRDSLKSLYHVEYANSIAIAEMMLELDDYALVLLDYYLVNDTAVPLLSLIRRIHTNTRVCLLTHHLTEDIVKSVAPFRPEGILTKGETLSGLLESVREILSGRFVYDPLAIQITMGLLTPESEAPPPPPSSKVLSETGTLVLQLTAEGYTAQEIAVRLSTSVANVNLIRRDLKHTFGLHSLADLVSYYITTLRGQGNTP
jgi:DNA-binding NarL/FixJ family response regulator